MFVATRPVNSAERDTSMVPALFCTALIGIAIVIAAVLWVQEQYSFALLSLAIGLGAFISWLLNKHARGRGCVATWQDALQLLPADTRTGVRIESNSSSVEKVFDELRPAIDTAAVHLRNDDEGILQLEAESLPSVVKDGMDFGAATMLVQRIGRDTALRSLFLLSRLLKDGGPIILVDARPLGREGAEWTNGTSVLRVEDVAVQGPRMWFTGPWKPGYVTVLSSRFASERYDHE